MQAGQQKQRQEGSQARLSKRASSTPACVCVRHVPGHCCPAPTAGSISFSCWHPHPLRYSVSQQKQCVTRSPALCTASSVYMPCTLMTQCELRDCLSNAMPPALQIRCTLSFATAFKCTWWPGEGQGLPSFLTGPLGFALCWQPN